ncbi:MAG: hypothetical protein ACI3XF_05490 [Eubacteriales bacterium]
MLDLKNNLFENIEDSPKEHYTFQFDPSAIVPVEKKYIGLMKKRMIGSIIAGLLLVIIGVFSDRALLGFGVGVLFISVVGHIKGISAYKKLYTKSRDKYRKTLYDYTLYEEYLIVWISSDDAIRQLKVKLDEIKKAQIIQDHIVMEIDGQLFLMKKDELMDNSYFLSICNK